MRFKGTDSLRQGIPAMVPSVLLLVLSGLLTGCASTTQVEATPPTVTYRYDVGAEDDTWNRAEGYCGRYGLNPQVVSRDPDRRYVTYACT